MLHLTPQTDNLGHSTQYCSTTRTQAGFEKGDLARLPIRKEGNVKKNEKCFATVKKMPFLLDNREFVSKMIWRKNIDGSISVAAVPVNDAIDYGGKVGSIERGKMHLNLTVKTIGR